MFCGFQGCVELFKVSGISEREWAVSVDNNFELRRTLRSKMSALDQICIYVFYNR